LLENFQIIVLLATKEGFPLGLHY